MEKSVTFQWIPEAEKAFQYPKRSINQSISIGYPCSNGKYLLDTDANNQAIGAVLSQIRDDEEKPLAYYCQILSQQERQCGVTLLELLTMVKAVRHFHPLSLSLSHSVPHLNRTCCLKMADQFLTP